MLFLRIVFEKQTNEGRRTRERVEVLTQQQEAGKIPFVPTISSVLLISNGYRPHAMVKLYQLNTTFCQPLFLSFLSVLAHHTEARIGGHAIIGLVEFDGRGATFSMLEFLCFAGRKTFSWCGQNRVNDDKSDATQMMKWCILVKWLNMLILKILQET